MLPLVEFPDLLAWLRSWLLDQLADRPEPYAADVFVATAVPTERRDRMVILRYDGGPVTDVAVHRARLGINVWATEGVEADRLAELVRGLLAATPGAGPIRAATVGGPTPVVESSPQHVRYLTAELTVRGHPRP